MISSNVFPSSYFEPHKIAATTDEKTETSNYFDRILADISTSTGETYGPLPEQAMGDRIEHLYGLLGRLKPEKLESTLTAIVVAMDSLTTTCQPDDRTMEDAIKLIHALEFVMEKVETSLIPYRTTAKRYFNGENLEKSVAREIYKFSTLGEKLQIAKLNKWSRNEVKTTLPPTMETRQKEFRTWRKEISDLIKEEKDANVRQSQASSLLDKLQAFPDKFAGHEFLCIIRSARHLSLSEHLQFSSYSKLNMEDSNHLKNLLVLAEQISCVPVAEQHIAVSQLISDIPHVARKKDKVEILQCLLRSAKLPDEKKLPKAFLDLNAARELVETKLRDINSSNYRDRYHDLSERR